MDNELKDLLDKARAGGASQQQLQDIVDRYKSKNQQVPPTKGVKAEGNGVSASASANTASSSASEKKPDTYSWEKSRQQYMEQTKGINKPDGMETIKSSDGQTVRYDPRKQHPNVDPRSGKVTLTDRNSYDIPDKINKNASKVDADKILRNLGDDKKRTDLSEASQFIPEYIKEKGLEGKIVNPVDIAKGQYLLGEDISAEDAIKRSGIDMNDFNKFYKEKLDKESDAMPYYQYQGKPTAKGWKKESGEVGVFADDQKINEKVGNISQYGFDVNDFNNYLKTKNPRLNQLISEDVLDGVTPAESENQIFKGVVSYANDRLSYLANYKANLEYRKERGQDVKGELQRVDQETNQIKQGLDGFVKDQLPNFTKTLDNKKRETAKEYTEYKDGQRNMIDGIGKFGGNVWRGLENGLADIGVYLSDKVGADKFAEEWRVSKDLDKIIENDDLLYSYESGKVVRNSKGNFLVSDNGSIIDLDTKKNITSIAKDLGINSAEIIKEAEKSKESDYSFSAGNTAYMSGDIIGNLAIQLIGTKGLSSALGTAVKGSMAANTTQQLSGMIVGGAMSYTSTYENVLQTLRDEGIDDSKATKYANEVATIVGATVAATSSFAYNPKALQVFNKNPQMGTIISKAIDAEREGGKKAMGKVVRDHVIKSIYGSVSEGATEAVQENLEYVAEQLVNASVNQSLGQDVLNENITGKDIINNSILAFASSSAVASLGEVRENRNIDKKDLYNILGSDFDGFKNQLETMVNDGFVTQEKADVLTNDVEKFMKYANKLPKEVPQDKLFDVIDKVAERNDLEVQKKNVDKAFAPQITEKINAIDEDINKLMNYGQESENTVSESEPDTNGEITDAETEQGQVETQQEEEINPESDINYETLNDIEKVDLSTTLGINKAIEILDNIDNDLKRFGDETLGINLPVAVARGAVKTMKAAANTAKVGADVISEGINYVRQTEWYKNLNDSDREEFDRKGLVQSLVDSKPEYEKTISESTIKPDTNKNNKPVKTVIRQNTGQTDQSKKVTTTESKLLKEKFKNLSRGFKTGSSEMNQLKKDFIEQVKMSIKGLGNNITESETKTILNQVGNITNNNIDTVTNVVDNLIERVEARKRKQDLKGLKKMQKRAIKKAKTTYGNTGENVRALASIDPEMIPDEKLDEYKELIQNLSTANDVDFDRVNKMYESLSKDIDKFIEKKYTEKLNSTKDVKDNTESVEVYNQEIKNVRYFEDMSDYEKNLITKLKKIPLSYIETLSKAKIDRLNKSLIRINQDGYIDNKVINNIVMGHTAFETAKEMNGKVGDIILKPFGGINSFIDRVKGKDFVSKDFEKRFFNVMLQHIDTAVKGINGTMFYDNIVHPVSSAFNKAESRTAKINNEFTSLFTKAVNSSKRNEFDFNALLQFYFRQREFETNPKLKGTKVFSLEEHMKVMRENEKQINMSKATFDRIFELYESFPKKSEEMFEQFNNAEKAVIEFIDRKIAETEIENRDVNNHLRGETLVYTDNYFPRSNSLTKGSAEEIDISNQIQGMIGSTSVKSDSSHVRTATKANPLRFDTSSIFMNYIKDANIESELSEPVKQTGMLISNLKRSENESLVTVASGLENSIKALLEAQMNRNPYATTTNLDKLFKTVVKRTFTRMLIDPIRLTYDILSNYIPIYTANIDRLSDIVKANKMLNRDFINVFDKEINSVQSERLGGARSVDLKDAHTTTLSKSKYKTADPSRIDNLMDLAMKNKITDFSDAANRIYYDIADKPAQHMWKYHLVTEFKKLTGNNLDSEKYVKDVDYRNSIKDDLQKATRSADKLTSNLFNTASTAEQKLNIQQKRSDWATRFNSFMRSFTFNENRVFWDSFNGTFGTGTTTFESKAEALRTFGIVNLRGIAYSYASQMMLSFIGQMLGFEDDDDDANMTALKRSLGQHGTLIFFGNKGTAFNMVAAIAFERFHKMYVESEKDKKTGKDKKYDPYKDSILYATPEKGSVGQYFGSLGAEGYAIKSLYDSYDLSMKILDKYVDTGEITKDDWIEFKTAQITTSLLSQTTGLPIERMGKLVQKSLSSELKQKKERQKKLDKYRKELDDE